MEDRIGGIDEVPVPENAVGVEAHAEFPVRVDGARREVEQGRVEAQAERLYAPELAGDRQVGGEVVTAMDFFDIIVEMSAPGPCGPIYDVERGCAHGYFFPCEALAQSLM